MLALLIAVSAGVATAIFYFKPPQLTPVSRSTLAKLNEEERPLE